MIAATIATDLRSRDGYEDGARMALEFALSEDPPREWPEGSFGHHLGRTRLAGDSPLQGQR